MITQKAYVSLAIHLLVLNMGHLSSLITTHQPLRIKGISSIGIFLVGGATAVQLDELYAGISYAVYVCVLHVCIHDAAYNQTISPPCNVA